MAIRGNQIMTLPFGNKILKFGPIFGENGIRTKTANPVVFLLPPQENAAQNQFSHTMRIGLRIRQCESTAPRAAKYQPLLNPQKFPHTLNIVHQIPRSILLNTRIRQRAACSTLVNQHDLVTLRIEKAAMQRTTTASRATVQENHRFALRIA